MSKPNIVITERKVLASKDTEQNVLGLCLTSKESATEILGILSPEDFYWDEHKEIIRAISNVYNSTESLDSITVINDLEKRGQLAFVGGSSVISMLVDITVNPTKAEEHAKAVKQWSSLRKIKEINEQTISLIQTGKDLSPSEILDSHTKALFDISDEFTTGKFITVRESVDSLMPSLSESFITKKSPNSTSSGIRALDKYIGGFKDGSYTILAGRTSTGKTQLALQFALNIAGKGDKKPCAIFSLEMTGEELSNRLLANLAKVNGFKLENGLVTANEWKEVNRIRPYLQEKPIYIDETTNLTVVEIKTKVKKLIKEVGKLGIVIIDYIGLINPGKGSDNTYFQIGEISRELKNFAKEVGVAIVILCQLNRNTENRPEKRPGIGDLADSDKIARDADLVMLLYRDSYYKNQQAQPTSSRGYQSNRDKGQEQGGDYTSDLDDNTLEIIIAKQRKGPCGVAKVYFDLNTGRITDFSSGE